MCPSKQLWDLDDSTSILIEWHVCLCWGIIRFYSAYYLLINGVWQDSTRDLLLRMNYRCSAVSPFNRIAGFWLIGCDSMFRLRGYYMNHSTLSISTSFKDATHEHVGRRYMAACDDNEKDTSSTHVVFGPSTVSWSLCFRSEWGCIDMIWGWYYRTILRWKERRRVSVWLWGMVNGVQSDTSDRQGVMGWHIIQV